MCYKKSDIFYTYEQYVGLRRTSTGGPESFEKSPYLAAFAKVLIYHLAICAYNTFLTTNMGKKT